MKIIMTTIAAVGAALMFASPAAAQSQWEKCHYNAQVYAVNNTNVGGATVGSAVLGGLLGLGISSVTGNVNTAGNVAIGAGVGGVAGFVASNAKQKQLYDSYMASCMGGMQPQPVYAPVGPGQAMVKTGANVRTGPGTGYAVITQLAGGTVVNLGQISPNNWCAIGFYSGSGWMACSLLQY
jgi:hypothetical protein